VIGRFELITQDGSQTLEVYDVNMDRMIFSGSIYYPVDRQGSRTKKVDFYAAKASNIEPYIVIGSNLLEELVDLDWGVQDDGS
jgi:hypothetical protein